MPEPFYEDRHYLLNTFKLLRIEKDGIKFFEFRSPFISIGNVEVILDGFIRWDNVTSTTKYKLDEPINKIEIKSVAGGTSQGRLIISNIDYDSSEVSIVSASEVRYDNKNVGTSALELSAISDGYQNSFKRSSIIIYNNSGSTTIYVGGDNSVTTVTGMPVPAGGSLTLNTSDEVWAITAAGTADIRITEQMISGRHNLTRDRLEAI